MPPLATLVTIEGIVVKLLLLVTIFLEEFQLIDKFIITILLILKTAINMVDSYGIDRAATAATTTFFSHIFLTMLVLLI